MIEANELLLNEIKRDSFYKAIPLPFRLQVKARMDKQIKAIINEWKKVNSRDKVAKMKGDFYQYAEGIIIAVNDFKPLQRKHAFNSDALNKKAWLLSNSLNDIHNEFKHYFAVNENSTEDEQRGALGATGQMYCRLRRLTLTGLTEDYQWLNRVDSGEQLENILTIEPLDWDKFAIDNEYQSEILSTLLKALEPEWWVRRYKKEFKRMAEEFAVRVGLVGKASRYCTDYTLSEVKANDRRNQLFLEGIEIERDDGFKVSLSEVIKHSLSNPFNRHAQLMARIAGLERLGKHENLSASFYTITAPSRFHYNSPKYDGSTPNQAREYLQKTWEKLRAKVNRLGVYHFGVRVAEAHKDACPHWHMMLWCEADQQELLDSVFKAYAMEVDQDELVNDGAIFFEPGKKARSKGVVFRTPRLEIKRMLPHLGHPTGYIIKYISKNIKAHDDSKAPDDVLTYADRVNAWARTHRIRQFQFIGDAKITAWNEARRMSPEVIKAFNVTLTKSAEKFIEICRSNDWFNYVRFMRKHTVNVNKEIFRDEESQFFSKKTEIKGLSVEHKSIMRQLYLEQLQRHEQGIKAINVNAFSFDLMFYQYFKNESLNAFNTRFYTWTKSNAPPDRAEQRSPEGVS